MAVIRCPSCGKPNPDFLDKCQYCETALHAPATGSGPATPPGPASATGAPEEDAFAKLRAATGAEGEAVATPDAELPDWLNRLSGREPDQPAAAADEPAGKVANWLDTLRTTEPTGEAESSDWYWTGTRGGSDTSKTAAGQAEELPDWLRSVGEPTPAAASTPPAETGPDWLRNLGTPAAPATPKTPEPPKTGSAFAATNEELPDWLRAASAPPAPPQAASASAASADELPDWMRTIGTPIAAAKPGPAPAVPAFAAASEELSDLLPPADQTRSTAAPSEQIPAWLHGLGATGILTATSPLPKAPAGVPPLPPPEPAEGQPDWLHDRGAAVPPAQPKPPSTVPAFAAQADEAPPAAAPSEEIPAWLHGLGATGILTATSHLPKTPAGVPPLPPPEPAEVQPDWLHDRGTAAPPAQPKPPSAVPAFAASADEAPLTAAPLEAVPEWLHGLGATGILSATSPLPGMPPGVPPLPPLEPAEGQPDWLHDVRTAAPPAQPQPPQAVPAFAASAEEVPDWLRAAGGAVEPPAATPAAEGELPDWLHGLGTAAAAQPESTQAAPVFAASDEAVPDWLRSLSGAQAPQPAPAARVWAQPAPLTPTPAEEQPEWLRSLGVTPSAAPEPIPGAAMAGGEEQPDWLRALGIPTVAGPEPAAGPSAPAVSPFIGAATIVSAKEASQAAAAGAASVPASSAALSVAAPAQTMALGAGLAKVALPSWLEAMRPVEIQRPTIAPEVDEYEETVGVLAGLRGVLRAEPVAAQPGQSATLVHKLEVSEAQAKQAGWLSQLLAKATEARQAARRGFTVPVARLAVFAVLFAAVIVPLSVPEARGLFAPANAWPASAQAAFNTVDHLSPAQPVLVAFDYDPAQSGELDPLAQALLSHLLRRGVPVVGISTSPAGAAIGDSLLSQTFVSYTYDTDYLNLGYLPGGPLGVVQISNGLRSSFTTDFRNTYPSDQYASVWDTPILKRTEQLSDFGVVVLISASPDTVRAWVEQIQSASSKPLLIAAVSAGADPLVRPYYETQQLQGLISGILGAAQYEKQSGVGGLASGILWDTLGFGLTATVVLLLVGGVYYGLAGVIRRQKRQP